VELGTEGGAHCGIISVCIGIYTVTCLLAHSLYPNASMALALALVLDWGVADETEDCCSFSSASAIVRSP